MFDLEDFGYNSVNITSFRLIEHTEENLRSIEDMQRFNAKSYSKVLQVRINDDDSPQTNFVQMFIHRVKSIRRRTTSSSQDVPCHTHSHVYLHNMYIQGEFYKWDTL